jgi:hypothetical protein
MRTPYVPHVFGAAAWERVHGKQGWLVAGVASSIAWPQDDVLVVYDGVEYLLMGALQNDKPASPCVATPCPRKDLDDALALVLRFVSVLGWFKRGYVDVAGFAWGTRPFRYGHQRNTYTDLTQGGRHGFDCNHMPIIEDDRIRQALAFWREGRRLRNVHEAYSFLSFFKVIESQFSAKERVAWIEANLDLLAGKAAARVAELRTEGVNVNEHIYSSGRCAVAHASIGGDIVDPDIPADRRQIRDDLVIIEALAQRFLAVDGAVPDEMVLYRERDRLTPWHPLMLSEGLSRLKAGGVSTSQADMGKLHGATVSVRLWPHAPPAQFRDMTLTAVESTPGCVKLQASNQRQTIFLFFLMDVVHGRLHTMLEEGGLTKQVDEVTEDDVATYTHYFHSVVANGQVELSIEGSEPVDCEVVIPVNIIPRVPKEAVAEALAQFRRHRGQAPA